MKEKKLEDLTKEEIGHLFPIEISAYDKEWPELFEREKCLIIETLPEVLFSRIEHFGSTSVPGLSAKNTIDMLLEVEFEETKNEQLILFLQGIGYQFNWQNEGNEPHMVFAKGYNPSNPGQQTYHIHAGPKQHPIWDRILFRDYLIVHQEIAHAYEELKQRLAAAFKHDRVGYRIAKTTFIQEVTNKAKAARA
jgi:GrpB-like predicted nucleotidyltransferase (UPF0157 family)